MRFLLTLLSFFCCFSAFSQGGVDESVNVKTAKTFLLTKKEDLNLTVKEIDELRVLKYSTSKKSNSANVYFAQTINGIEVHNASINVHINSNGEVFNYGSSVGEISNKSSAKSQPSINEIQAIQYAAAGLGYQFKSVISPVSNSQLKLNTRVYGSASVYSAPDLSGSDIPVKLSYCVIGNEIKLAWELNIEAVNGKNWYNVFIDVNTGEILLREDWMVSCNFGHKSDDHNCGEHNVINEEIKYVIPTSLSERAMAVNDGSSYRVYAAPVEAPSFGGRTLVNNPADDIASPYGWHDTNGAAGPEFTTTRGNNVHSYTDTNDDDIPDANSAPDGGAGLDFDFPVDLTQHPSNYRPAAVTNLFYFNNFIHDFAYSFGFDEVNGNFQQNNYGRGGIGNDFVRAEAQDGGGMNNANFGTPSDGSNPRMQMYLWNYSSIVRDGDFDNGIIAHEYGHGISNRLVGNSVSCLQNNEQMGEGWSDFFSTVTTWIAGTNLTSSRGIGTYALNQNTNGPGIRPTAYSYNMGINGSTYNTIKTSAVPHGVGYVWASMLWDLTVRLIDENGESAGLDIAVSLVMEGMKQTVCSPGFVSGRNGIIAADQLLYGGANTCLIWEVFARRGLGFSATQGSTNSVSDGVEAFDVPAVGTGTATPVSQSVCSGTPITTIALTSSPSGATFTWTRDNTANVTGIAASGSGNISGTLSSSVMTDQLVTFTITPQLNGCLGTAFTATVLVTASATYTSTPSTQSICSGNSITQIVLAGGAPGTVYNWTRDHSGDVVGIGASGSGDISGTLTNNTANPVTVTFTITPVNQQCQGAFITASVIVNPNPVTATSPASQTICSGSAIGQISLSSATSGASFQWTRDNTGSVTGIPASGVGNINGTLTNVTNLPITVTFTANASLNGCTGPNVTSTVLVNPAPVAFALPATQGICSQSQIQTIVLSGTVSGTVYNWVRNNTATVTGIPASGTGNISGSLINSTNAPITVTFTITPAANGCNGTPVTATVIVNPAPIASISATPNPVCTGEILYLSATGGISYAWTGPDGFASTQANPVRNITSSLQGGVYSVVITASPGCLTTLSTTVVVNQGPVGDLTVSANPVCTGNTLTLDAPTGSFYSWTGPNGFTSTIKSPVIADIQQSGDGVYTVVVTTNQGCVKSYSLDVIVNQSPVIKAGFDNKTACMDADLHLFGYGGGAYAWSGPNGFVSTLQNPIINDVNSANSGNYVLIVTSPNGCTNQLTNNITIQPLPVVSAASSDYDVCEGDAVFLSASGNGVSYKWNGPAGYVSNYQNPVIHNIPGMMSGVYTVESQGNTGCVNSASLEITVHYRISSEAWANPNPVCEGDTLNLFATGGTSYIWTGPNGFYSYEQNPVIHNVTLAAAGRYAVIVYNDGGCENAVNSFEVGVTPVPTKAIARANPNPVLEGGFVQFSSGPGYSHYWTGPLGFTSTLQNPVINKATRLNAGVYTVVITNEDGCTSTAKVTLRVIFKNKKGQSITTGEDYDGISGIESQSVSLSGIIYPNPTKDVLNFDVNSATSIKYTLYNVAGQIIRNNVVTESPVISTGDLLPGVYFIKFNALGESEVFQSKFVKSE